MPNDETAAAVFKEFRHLARSIAKRLTSGQSQRARDLADEAESYFALVCMESLDQFDPDKGTLYTFLRTKIYWHLRSKIRTNKQEQQDLAEFKDHRQDVETGWQRRHSFRHEPG